MAFDPPVAADWDGWRDFDRQFAEHAPIRYRINKQLMPWLRVRKMKIKDLKWKVYHRFHPEHRYNIVKTELKPGYYDIDTRMMYACFALLVEYVEKELASWEKDSGLTGREAGLKHLDDTITYNDKLPPNHTAFDRMPDHQVFAAKEAKELYLWWETYRDDDDSEWDNCPVQLGKGRGHMFDVLSNKWRAAEPAKAAAWDAWAQNARAESERKSKEADEMLKRLIAVRHHLWT